jgi:predicted alpha/beta hydrolase family esterase
MKQQVVVIHGGDTFDTYEQALDYIKNYQIDFDKFRADKQGWKRGLRQQLGNEFEVILPSMPNSLNAKFEEWKMWFEKLFPYLQDNVILVGHSLGGIFLAKYLSENKFPKKIKAVMLVAAVFDEDTARNSLASFTLPSKLDLQTEKVFLYHSKDDPVVPFSALSKYKQAFPNATERVFEDRGHFNQEQFPEIAGDIVKLFA